MIKERPLETRKEQQSLSPQPTKENELHIFFFFHAV